MAQTQYKLTDVQARNGKLGAPVWVVYKDSVYDVTSYVDQHPGGNDAILAEAGTDATSAFQDVGHSDDARTILAKFKIGEIVERGGACGVDIKYLKLTQVSSVDAAQEYACSPAPQNALLQASTQALKEEKKYDANGKKKKKVVAAKDEDTGRSCLNTVTCGLLG